MGLKKNKILIKKTPISSGNTMESPQKPEEPGSMPMTQKLKNMMRKFPKDTVSPNLFKKIKTGFFYAAGVIAIAAIFLVIDLHSDQRTYPQSWIGPIYVGYLKQPDARSKVEAAIQEYFKTPLIFSLNGNIVGITPQELGISINLDQVVNPLPFFQFSKSIPGKFVSFIWQKYSAPLQFSIDGDKTLEVLEKKFDLANKRAHNARLVVQNKKFTIEPEAPGEVLDRQTLIKNLENVTSHLGHEVVPLQLVMEEPDIISADITPQQERITGIIAQPLRLWYGGKKWKIDPSAHMDALHFEEERTVEFKNIPFVLPVLLPDSFHDQNPNPNYTLHKSSRLAFDTEVLTPFLNEKIIGSIDRPSSDVKIYKDTNGKAVIEGKGFDGVTLPPTRLVASLNLAMNNGIGNLDMPVYKTPAKVEISEDLKVLGIRELISTGHTTFFGSPPNRVYNIKFGIQKYNGVIIQPGETFSFNKYIGEVDGRSGFLPEKVIKQDKIELEFGGGICQVSTTAYRAALLGGLPMKERAPHSIKVAYYAQVLGHGLDATIYPGSHDLKFINDTPGAILIQAYEDDGNAYFKFYGTNDGRKVYLDGPYGGGLHYQWYRRIVKNDGKETKESIISDYKVLPPPAPPSPTPAVAGPTTNTPATTPKPTAIETAGKRS